MRTHRSTRLKSATYSSPEIGAGFTALIDPMSTLFESSF
jgi:hypothetical protein